MSQPASANDVYPFDPRMMDKHDFRVDNDESKARISSNFAHILEQSLADISEEEAKRQEQDRVKSFSRVTFSSRPSKVVSDRDEEIGENVLLEKPYLKKYADKIKDYDNLINANIESFITNVSNSNSPQTSPSKDARKLVFSKTSKSSSELETKNIF